MRRLLSFLLLTIAAAACGTAAPPRVSTVSSADTGREAWLDAFARGYFPGRSGQIFIVPREGNFVVDRDPLYAFMHGSPWPYDTHIPLLFAGAPFIKQGVSNDRVTQQDVVPTLAALLGTTPPATATGRVLSQALATTTVRPRVVALFVLDLSRHREAPLARCVVERCGVVPSVAGVLRGRLHRRRSPSGAGAVARPKLALKESS